LGKSSRGFRCWCVCEPTSLVGLRSLGAPSPCLPRCVPAGARARSLRPRAGPLPAHLVARRPPPRAANRPPLARAPSAADRGHSLHSRDDFIWCGASCARLTTLPLASPLRMPQNVSLLMGRKRRSEAQQAAAAKGTVATRRRAALSSSSTTTTTDGRQSRAPRTRAPALARAHRLSLSCTQVVDRFVLAGARAHDAS
jgi:hypothetical protein